MASRVLNTKPKIDGVVENIFNPDPDIVPNPTTLGDGQIAVNTSDTKPRLFIKKADGSLAIFEDSVVIQGKIDSGSTALTNHIADKNNPHAVTKSQIGLGSVVDKEQLGKEENAVSATTSKYQDVIRISGLIGKTVVEVKKILSDTIKANADKGCFILNLDSVTGNLIDKWDTDNHVLIAGSTFYYAEVTNAIVDSNKAFAHIEFTTYGDKTLYTTSIVNDSWQPMRKVMYLDDTAADSNKLGGIVATNYYHSGNSNKVDVDWTCNNLFTNWIAKPSNNDSNGEILVVESAHGSGVDKSGGGLLLRGGLGTGTGTGGDVHIQTSTKSTTSGPGHNSTHTRLVVKADSGNVGIGTETPTEKLEVDGNIRNIEHNFVIQTNQTWNGWTRGLRWVKQDNINLGSIQLGGGSGDSVTQMTFNIYDSELMRINVNGNIGISTNNPTEKLHVVGNGLFTGTGKFGGDIQSGGNILAKADVVAYSSKTDVLIDTLAGAGYLYELGDVTIDAPKLNDFLVYNADTTNPRWVNKSASTLKLATLDTNSKIPLSQLPDSIIGGMVYQGTWNASTNVPDLTKVPSKGQYYIVSTAGIQFGVDWNVGDWIVSHGDKWDKIDNTDQVTSVAGRQGAVVLTKDDVGLNNVRNVAQLGQTETAADSNKLGGRNVDGFVWNENVTSTATENFDANNIAFNSFKHDYRWNNTAVPIISSVMDLSYSPDWRTQLQFVPNGQPNIYFRSRYDGSTWTNWLTLYHSGNSNLSTVDWNCKDLSVSGGITINPNATFGTNIKLKKISNDTLSMIDFLDTTGTRMGWLGANISTLLYNGNDIYHAGNSNKSDVDWTANNLNLTGGVYKISDTEQWLYQVQRSDATAVRGILSDGFNLQFATNSASRLTILSGGNIGVRKPNPTEALDVNGNIKSSGYIHSPLVQNLTGLLELKSQSATLTLADDGINILQTNAGGTGTFEVYGSQYVSKSLDVIQDANIGGSLISGKVKLASDATKGYLQLGGKTDDTGLGVICGLNITQLAKLEVTSKETSFSGNVAVGKPTATSALDVNGTIKASADVVAYSVTSDVLMDQTAAGASSLIDLSDVNITNPSIGQTIVWNPTANKWENKAVSWNTLSDKPTSFTPTAHDHTGGSFSVSDKRLKLNIQPIENVQLYIKALEPVKYDWKPEAKSKYGVREDVGFGFIAQDVEKVIPDAVRKLEGGEHLGINYEKIIPFLVGSMQEMMKEIRELKDKNNHLSEEIEKLKSK